MTWRVRIYGSLVSLNSEEYLSRARLHENAALVLPCAADGGPLSAPRLRELQARRRVLRLVFGVRTTPRLPHAPAASCLFCSCWFRSLLPHAASRPAALFPSSSSSSSLRSSFSPRAASVGSVTPWFECAAGAAGGLKLKLKLKPIDLCDRAAGRHAPARALRGRAAGASRGAACVLCCVSLLVGLVGPSGDGTRNGSGAAS